MCNSLSPSARLARCGCPVARLPAPVSAFPPGVFLPGVLPPGVYRPGAYLPGVPPHCVSRHYVPEPVRATLQAYVRSHINTAIYIADFLKHARARGPEKIKVDDLVRALRLLLVQSKYVAAPPKPKTVSSLSAKNLWVDYTVLAKGSYSMHE